MAADKAQGAQLLARMQKNAEAVKLGKVSQDFKGLPEMAKDPTSPLAPQSSVAMMASPSTQLVPTSFPLTSTHGGIPSIAAQITGQVPISAPSTTKNTPIQSRDEVQRLAISAAAQIGVTVEEIHIEDLLAIVASDTTPLTAREVKMYIRGVAKTNQVSVTTAMTKLIEGVEVLLAKNQKTMQTAADGSKSLLEKMNLISTKIDSITPVICSTIASEAAEGKKVVSESIGSLTQYLGKAPAVLTTTEPPQSPETPSTPTAEDIRKMCVSMGCPQHITDFATSKLAGMVTWEQHRMVMSGAVTVLQFREMMEIWKSMLPK